MRVRLIKEQIRRPWFLHCLRFTASAGHGTFRRRSSPPDSNRFVLTGASLLRIVASLPGAATLQEIAEASGMLTARTHRYLLSLVEAGLLEIYHSSDVPILVAQGPRPLPTAPRPDRRGARRFRCAGAVPWPDRALSFLTVRGSNGPTIVN